MLVAQIFHTALIQRIDAVYCFSTDAQEYWAHIGFVGVPASAVLQRVPQVPQVLQFADLGRVPTEVAWRYDIQS
jgi:N-acetylglutamate synthase-like GNAT family acetyltransferase